ncbi:hypothetical protein CBER1_05784 [Cercospora berteroae]|uniref:Uncharacterized protein n=1 Tax=Cercospora berteroae TaxID=357750 RepID=A0A2S6CHY6_9PEZI|nr:hypothetical protein CBER1_05784 [Cercospora berteroae]
MASYPQVELFPIDPAYQSASSAKSQSASILQSSTAGLITEPPQYHVRPEEPRSISKFLAVLFQLLALLWVGGIGYLLYVNFKQHILGASAWCTFNTCFPQVWAKDLMIPRALLVKFDRDTHNLLGGLQLAAKLAEIWFCLIAAWLVYLKTVQLGQSAQGLPIGYMLRHIEFANTLSLFDRLMWTTSVARRHRKGQHRLLSYLCLTGLLCVLCNLMGPAVAVLLVPSLQWIDTQADVTAKFDSFYSGEPPKPDEFAMKDALQSRNGYWRDCGTLTYMRPGQYRCSGVWASSLDAWVEAVFAKQGGTTPVSSSQNNIYFTYNKTMVPATQFEQHDVKSTFYEEMFWTPSRQVLSALGDDLQYVKDMSTGAFPETESRLASNSSYNNTVSTVVHRIAPALGALVGSWYNVSNDSSSQPIYDIQLRDERTVRCYKNYTLLDAVGCGKECGNAASSYTRCIKLERDKRAGFWIDQRYMAQIAQWGPYTRYEHFVSDVVFLPMHTVPHSMVAVGFEQRCLDLITDDGSECNWDALFEMNNEDARLATRTRRVNTLHITWNSSILSTLNFKAVSVVTLAIDFVAFQGMADYALDTSWISNPLMQLDFQPEISPHKSKSGFQPIEINPNWTLATWAAGYSQASIISDDDIDKPIALDVSRAAPARLQRYFELPFLKINKTDLSLSDWDEAVKIVPVMQMLSIIDFGISPAGASDPAGTKILMKQYGSIQVWAYGTKSRTGWLGVAVAGCGCLVVLYEVYVGLRDRRQFRSPTEILISALQHNSNGEFDGLRKEKGVARVSFRLEDDCSSAGRLRFERAR